MSDKKSGISGSLKRSAAQKGAGAGDRFDAADSAMSQGGYAAKKSTKTAGGKPPQATSFRATEADQKLLVTLRADLMTNAGASVSNTDALRAGLRALEALTPDERLEQLRRAWDD